MGKRGPHKEPAPLKMAKGTYRRDRDAPLPFSADAPEQPEWLSEEAALVWAKVVEDLSQVPGLLARVDAYALSRYCSDWCDYWDAKRVIDEQGCTVVSDAGNLYQHPAVGVKNKAADRMTKFEARFGMTPSDRSGLHIEKPKQGVRRRQA